MRGTITLQLGRGMFFLVPELIVTVEFSDNEKAIIKRAGMESRTVFDPTDSDSFGGPSKDEGSVCVGDLLRSRGFVRRYNSRWDLMRDADRVQSGLYDLRISLNTLSQRGESEPFELQV